MFTVRTNRTAARRTCRNAAACFEPLERRELMSAVVPGGSPVPLTGGGAPGGTVVFDRVTPITVKDASGGLIVKGSVHEQVIRETRSGTLDFYQSIHCDATSFLSA